MAKEKAAEDAKQDKKAKKEKKGKGKKLVFIAVPVLLIAGAGSYFGLGMLSSKPAKAAVQPPINFDIGPITTNLSDGHIIQEQMTVMVSGGVTSAELKTDQPQITNMVIETLSGWSYNALLSPSGKGELRNQIETRLDSLLKTIPGTKAKVSELYFTNFIMQ
ncbi:MAG: flagellar basal body-associated FliL family protein [Actinomycetota bacterium]|nr:flagellar basal body-associated FliL family protein [Actinomycetota bacterium]